MTTIEKVARAQFEAWRGRMDEVGEHEHDLHTFEQLSERERDFSFHMARVAVGVLKERLAGTVCEPALVSIMAEAPNV